jgi:SAM-dependent methyltransferase
MSATNLLKITSVDADPWVLENLGYIPDNGDILDLACGSGRNARHMLTLGHKAVCVDINIGGVHDLEKETNCEVLQADLENGNPWPLTQTFDAIIVINYLHRPLFPRLTFSLKKGGVLIYRTFMIGNEQYGRPSNPEYLLEQDELFTVFNQDLSILAFDQGYEEPAAMVQKICARK